MYSRGFIPLSAKQYFDRKWQECLDRLLYDGRPITVGAMQECNLLDDVLEAAGKPNMYNTDTFIPYDAIIGRLFKFLNNPEVQTILHARGKNIPGINFVPEERNMDSEDSSSRYFAPKMWQICNDDISESMQSDHPVSTVPALAFITQHIR
jgi:hypothetical protein